MRQAEVLAGAVRCPCQCLGQHFEEAGLTRVCLNSQALAAAAIQGQDPAFVLVEDA